MWAHGAILQPGLIWPHLEVLLRKGPLPAIGRSLPMIGAWNGSWYMK